MPRNFFEELIKFLQAQENHKTTSQEEATFEKNGIKTTVKVYFDERGLPTGVGLESEYIPTAEEEKENRLKLLKKELQQAIEGEDYHKCINIKAEIDSLKTNK